MNLTQIQAKSKVLRKCLETGEWSGPSDTSLIFYDLDAIDHRLDEISRSFPASSLHTTAVKANPLARILSLMNDRKAGAEVASLPELHLALKCGFPPERIVFDSPCKTLEEIEFALEKGVYLNADSFDELERIDQVMKKKGRFPDAGLRVNPQVGAGSILSTSVAGQISKFGVPLHEEKENLIRAYRQYPWLRGIHIHIGSQGYPAKLLIEGVSKMMDLFREINSAEGSPGKIRIVDIGGGLPVVYADQDAPESVSGYARILQQKFPILFSREITLITEFGRYIHANAGWAVSRIEYIKKFSTGNILVNHLGADFMLRECYNPRDWYHRIDLLDSRGRLKTSNDREYYSIAGPLCFAGDFIARDVSLPKAQEGDYILIHDVGAYTLSMWSRYNSRQIPAVIGYRGEGESFEWIRKGESPEEVTAFWT